VGRGEAFFLPTEMGMFVFLPPRYFLPPVLALASLARRKFGPNKVPFRRNQ